MILCELPDDSDAAVKIKRIFSNLATRNSWRRVGCRLSGVEKRELRGGGGSSETDEDEVNKDDEDDEDGAVQQQVHESIHESNCLAWARSSLFLTNFVVSFKRARIMDEWLEPLPPVPKPFDARLYGILRWFKKRRRSPVPRQAA